MTQNPFTLSFGKIPLTYINRSESTQTILKHFTSPHINEQVYMISGVRGSGKTVLLTEVGKILKENPQWITIELNSTRDLLTGLTSKLYEIPFLRPLLLQAKIDLSIFGIGVEISQDARINDIETGLTRIFEILKKHNKRLLISIDEVTNSPYMREFAAAFQIFIRQEYPIFLLMTGLFENISELQNNKSLTSLYRAQKIFLSPLNLSAIKMRYMELLHLPEETALAYARLTKGYPYAFQLMGYLKWENPSISHDELLAHFDENIQEYVYQKIWADMSQKDQTILLTIAEIEQERGSEKPIAIKDIRERADITPGLMNIYRNRLKDKEIIDTSTRGYISITLPRFTTYIRDYYLDL